MGICDKAGFIVDFAVVATMGPWQFCNSSAPYGASFMLWSPGSFQRCW